MFGTQMFGTQMFGAAGSGAVGTVYVKASHVCRLTFITSRQHTTDYALYVGTYHAAAYPLALAARHLAVGGEYVQASHEAAYEPLLPVSAAEECRYNVEQNVPVASAIDCKYALTVSSAHTTEQADAPISRVQSVLGYGDAITVRRTHAAPGDTATLVRRGHTSYNELTRTPKKGHGARYYLLTSTRGSHTGKYDLSLRNYVQVHHRTYYTVSTGVAGAVGLSSTTVLHDSGVSLSYDKVSVTTAEGEYVWSCDVSLTDPAHYLLVERGDQITVTLEGVPYLFVVESKSLSRDEITDVGMALRGRSPAITFLGEEASRITYTETAPRMASDLVEYLAGVPVDWRIYDWLIPAYRFSTKDQLPIEAIRQITAAIGAVIESNPDGSLYVRYLFPVSVPDLPTTTPDFTLTDIDDNLSATEGVALREVYNKYRIRDSAPAVEDWFEWEGDEGSLDTGTLHAYPYPWRGNVATQCTDTSGAVTYVYQGILRREEEETVEVVDGKASLRYPAVAVISEEWFSDPLAGLYVPARTKDLFVSDTATNYGYGVVRVRYYVDSMQYRVRFSPGRAAQFILVDG